jgi:hypothetical protein
VEHKDKDTLFPVCQVKGGVQDANKIIKDFWNTINSEKVNESI